MRTAVTVVGSGESSDPELLRTARQLGSAIAREGWVLVNGGRASGIMDASAEGAHAEKGLVIGILPEDTGRAASKHIDVGVRTGMGNARNNINVLSGDVVISLKGGPGTLSEIALALKSGRVVIPSASRSARRSTATSASTSSSTWRRSKRPSRPRR